MSKKENIVRYTLEELQAMQAAGLTESNWEKAASKTYEEIEAAIASDPDETGMIVDWSKATTVLPEPKAVLNMRVDRDVLPLFQARGQRLPIPYQCGAADICGAPKGGGDVVCCS